MTFAFDFQFYLKSDLIAIKCHPGYLKASLGYEEFKFEKFFIFDNFYAFLRPKRPTSKIPKKSKKSHFLKNSIFRVGRFLSPKDTIDQFLVSKKKSSFAAFGLARFYSKVQGGE